MLMCALFLPIAHETAGAARIRHSLRPLFGEGGTICTTSGASRRENNFRRPGQASVASADLRCAIAHRGTHTPRPISKSAGVKDLLQQQRYYRSLDAQKQANLEYENSINENLIQVLDEIKKHYGIKKNGLE